MILKLLWNKNNENILTLISVGFLYIYLYTVWWLVILAYWKKCSNNCKKIFSLFKTSNIK